MTTNNGQYNGWYVSPQTLSNHANALSDTLLVIGTTMRLTRLVVTDDLGQWWVKDPLDQWMHQHPKLSDVTDHDHELREFRSFANLPYKKCTICGELDGTTYPRVRFHRYLGGLECPYCVGFWIGAGVLASHSIAKRTGMIGLWRFAARALTLNEAAAHLGIKIGDFG